MTKHQSTQLVQKLWNYCNILRDDGLSHSDYVEQLTFGSVAPAPSGFALRPECMLHPSASGDTHKL